KCAPPKATKINNELFAKLKKDYPTINCPRIPTVLAFNHHFQCCHNESLPWNVDDLIGFQLVQLQSGQRYEKCLRSVKNFVNSSAHGAQCVEACSLNPIDWKQVSKKPEIAWNATQFLTYMLNSIKIPTINKNLTTKSAEQYIYWTFPNRGAVQNRTGWIRYADIEKEYTSPNTTFNKSVEIYCRYYLTLRGLAGSTIVH
ncbi:hypothetical protein Fcan01_28592, partial [Folsomia candida]